MVKLVGEVKGADLASLLEAPQTLQDVMVVLVASAKRQDEGTEKRASSLAC